jgi:DNA-binding transcriptional ArsR family regulator
MLAGEIQRRHKRIAALNLQVLNYSEKLAALDEAIALANSHVNPEALGCVKAHSQKYGGRGGLTSFLVSELCAAGNAGISAVDLTRLAAIKFEIEITTTRDLKIYRSTITRRLRALRDTGVIESVSEARGWQESTIWRKRTDDGLFGELLRQRDSIEGNSRG